MNRKHINTLFLLATFNNCLPTNPFQKAATHVSAVILGSAATYGITRQNTNQVETEKTELEKVNAALKSRSELLASSNKELRNQNREIIEILENEFSKKPVKAVEPKYETYMKTTLNVITAATGALKIYEFFNQKRES